MARKTRPGSCYACGAPAPLDPDTFQPARLCSACAAPAVTRARKATRAARRADREAVVVREPVALCDVCGCPSPRPGYRHDACADLVERGGDWPANMG